MPSQEDYLDSLLKDLNNEFGGENNSENPEPDMSDIDALLKAAEEGTRPSSKEKEQEDIMDLLNASGDADLQEIHDLLQKSDQNEAVEEPEDWEAVSADKAADKGKKDRKKEREAKKQEKRAAREAKRAAKKSGKRKLEEQAGQDAVLETAEDVQLQDALSVFDELEAQEAREEAPKKGIFTKLLDLFTEEDEEDEENDGIRLSDENKGILKEMDREKQGKKAAAKKKKTAKNPAKAKKQKVKKEKPRKERSKKKQPEKNLQSVSETLEQEKVSAASGKKLSLKKVLPVALACLSLCLALILLAGISSSYAGKSQAAAAYKSGDYQTCYENFFGKPLNESEEVMFHKSESILRIRLRLKEYEVFAKEDSQVQALDVLLQTVRDYPVLYAYAGQWNAQSEVAEEYARVLAILLEKYHLAEEQAGEINSIESDVDYTKMVTEIAQGTDYAQWKKGQEEQAAKEALARELPDMLPEEEELSQENFVDNMTH